VSRTRRAGIAASFGYLQFLLAIASGILLVPFILSRVGTEAYGVWLGFGELVAYSAMVDLGVLGVLPWLVAEADGRRDRAEIGRLVSAALVAAGIAAVLFGALALGVLAVAPGVAGITPEQQAAVARPLLLLIALTAATYPLRVFHAVLVGMQDAAFVGTLGIVQATLNVVLLAGLLAAGQGLYALAAAATVPTLVVVAVSAVRVRRVVPGLFRSLGAPSLALLRRVTAQGIGGWMAGMGWRMIAATSTFVVLAVAGPAAAVVYALTARLGEVLMQMSWQLPDAGLVGLAQLRGEGREARVREIVVAILRLTMIAAGAVACTMAALNPSFVSLWVGPDRFAGLGTNLLLAAGVLALSLGHSLFSTAATLGARVQIGFATVAQGVVHLGAAVVLGRMFGLAGVAAAALVSTAAVAYPVGVHYLRQVAGLGHAALWTGVMAPWSVRIALLALVGAGVGAIGWRIALWPPLALAPALAALYVWWMRPLYADLPFPARLRPWLARLRLVPEHGGAGVPLP
jgi:O-antigen/teichoic acid export membrane protein